jgi:hypothetical protein
MNVTATMEYRMFYGLRRLTFFTFLWQFGNFMEIERL